MSGLNLGDGPLCVLADERIRIEATGLQSGQVLGCADVAKNDADIA